MYTYIYVYTYTYGGKKLADTQAAVTKHYRWGGKHMRNTDGRRRDGGLHFFGWGRYCKTGGGRQGGKWKRGRDDSTEGGRGHHCRATTPESSICICMYICRGRGGKDDSTEWCPQQ